AARDHAETLPARLPDRACEAGAARRREGAVGDRDGVRVRAPEPLHQPLQAGDRAHADAVAATGARAERRRVEELSEFASASKPVKPREVHGDADSIWYEYPRAHDE